MKKALALLLALAMALSLAACGGGTSAPAADDKPAAAPTDPPAPPADQPAADEPVEGEPVAADSNDITSWIIEDNAAEMTGKVNFWMPFNENQGMGKLIEEFNSYYPNIEVTLHTYSNNADGNMGVNTSIMAGEVDVLASFDVKNAYPRWENGMYMDLTDKIAEEGIDLIANWGTDAYKYDGTVYTFPCGGLSYYIAINMDAWNAAGLGELPTEWTWDEYLEACKAMTEYNDDGSVAVYGGSLNHSINDYMLAKYQVTGKDCYYNDETHLSSFNDPIVVNALKREYKAEVEDKIWYPLVNYRADGTDVSKLWVQGLLNSAMTNNLSRFLADKENNPVDFITGFAPFPTEEAGQTNYCSGVGYFSHAGVINGCQDEDAAWAFLKFYATYGCKWLIAAGHAPTWKGTDPASVVDVAFGSEESAAEVIDVESFARCFANPANPGYADTQVIAGNDLAAIASEYVLKIMNGEYTVEEGSALMQQLGDEAIQNAE